MSARVLAWHFVGDTLRDGRPVPPDGEWLIHEGDVKMCASGLHASRHPFDALQYAPGAVLCRVECRDVQAEDGDKLVCRQRRIVKRLDVTDLLRDFACSEALAVADKWDCPPVVRRYLDGTDSDAASAAARDAAWDAALDAASAAARAAASAAQRKRFAKAVRAAFRVAK